MFRFFVWFEFDLECRSVFPPTGAIYNSCVLFGNSNTEKRVRFFVCPGIAAIQADISPSHDGVLRLNNDFIFECFFGSIFFARRKDFRCREIKLLNAGVVYVFCFRRISYQIE